MWGGSGYTAAMAHDGTTRRSFLTAAAAAASAAGARPLSAQSARRALGANDRINMGMIGVGGRGSGHVRSLNQRMEMVGDVKIVAISDIYSKRNDAALSATRLESKDLHRDYHDLLARSDVDGVFIATPDHWHAPMAIDALKAGKDVYLEKPVTLTIDEAKAVARTVAETGGVLQVGCQHTSDKRHHKARELIEDGWIGRPLWGQANYSRNSVYGEWNYEIDEGATAEDVGWEAFLGSAPKRPFSADRYFRWRKYWDYSGGVATDLFYHRLSPLRQMMGVEFPDARHRRRRHLRAQGPRGARHLHLDHRVRGQLLHPGQLDGQLGRQRAHGAGDLRAQGHDHLRWLRGRRRAGVAVRAGVHREDRLVEDVRGGRAARNGRGAHRELPHLHAHAREGRTATPISPTRS